jgi:hypothetical protein
MLRIIAVFTFLFAISASVQAADRTTLTISFKGAGGKTETRTVTKTLLPSDGISKVCGTPLYYAGMAEDGVRTFNCDGTGDYVDGTNRGTFTWYYAISPKDGSKLFIQSFNQWGMGPAHTDDPAVAVYMTYKGGNLDGETYGATIGVVQGQIQLSPNYASKR